MIRALLFASPPPSPPPSTPPSTSASPPPSPPASPPPSTSASPPPNTSASPPPSTMLVFAHQDGTVHGQTTITVCTTKWENFARSNKITPGVFLTLNQSVRVELFIENEMNSREKATRLLEAKKAREKKAREKKTPKSQKKKTACVVRKQPSEGIRKTTPHSKCIKLRDEIMNMRKMYKEGKLDIPRKRPNTTLTHLENSIKKGLASGKHLVHRAAKVQKMLSLFKIKS